MKKKIIFGSVMALVLIVLAGCNVPAQNTESDYASTQIHLFAQATLTKRAEEEALAHEATEVPTTESTDEASPTDLPATIAPTQVPPTSVAVVPVIPLTPVPATATSPAQTGNSISFAAGTTNGQLKDNIPANTTKRYSVRLPQNQLTEVTLNSTNTAYISITTSKGRKLVDFSNKWTWYRDYASENGDWYIDVQTGAYAADITLNVMAPQRLSFAAGKDTLTGKATIPAYYTHNFVLWANKDQTMQVNLNPADGLVLSIYKLGGDVLLSAGAGRTSFEGKLPVAGDYIINISNTSNLNRSVDATVIVR